MQARIRRGLYGRGLLIIGLSYRTAPQGSARDWGENGMRILHVISTLAEKSGGPPAGLAALAEQQAERGHQVTILPVWNGDNPTTLPVGVKGNLTVLPPAGKSGALFRDEAFRAAVEAAAKNSDIVHVHGFWRYHTRASLEAARKAGVPYIVDPDGCLNQIPRSHKKLLKSAYYTLFEKRVVDQADAIHCHSRKEQRELEELGLRTRRFVVPHPVNPGLLEIEPDFAQLAKRCPNLHDHHKVILYLGRLCWIKRTDLLLEAFIRLHAEFPDWHLLLAGPYEDADVVGHLRRRMRAEGMEQKVSMPGLVSGPVKVAALRRATVFAQPSSHESFGISVVEGMLFGLPLVLSDGIALCADVQEAGAGLVAPCELEPYTQALRTMLADDALRQQAAERSRELSQRFTPQAVAELMDQEYRRCLER